MIFSFWLIYPIIAAFLWATVNHLDKYLLEKYCKNREVGGLVIFSSLIGIPVSALIAFFDHSVLEINLFGAIIITIAGSVYIIGIIPYLYALDMDETTVVAPQALMLTAVTGVLGYFFLGEKITYTQLLGIVLTLLGALILSLDIREIFTARIKIKVFILMFISACLIGSHTFLFKYFAIDISFWKTIFWLHIGFILIALIFLIFFKRYRKEFISIIKTNPIKIISVNIAGEIITILGNLSAYYATLLAPLAIAETIIEGVQPVFVLIIGVFLTILSPSTSKEDLSFRNLTHKILSLTVMIFGLVLIT